MTRWDENRSHRRNKKQAQNTVDRDSPPLSPTHHSSRRYTRGRHRFRHRPTIFFFYSNYTDRVIICSTRCLHARPVKNKYTVWKTTKKKNGLEVATAV